MDNKRKRAVQGWSRGAHKYLLLLIAGLLLGISAGVWAADTDKDTLPDDWETAHGRNPNVADYTIHTRYANDRYELCAKDDSGTRCWDYAGNVLAITPFTSSSYTRPSLRSGTCASGGNYGDCSGNMPQWAPTSTCKRTEAATDYIACDTLCFGYTHSEISVPYPPYYVCAGSSFSDVWTTGDPGIWICQIEANGINCYGTTTTGFQTGSPLNIPITFNVDSDGDGSARPDDPDDLNPLVPANDGDGDGIFNGVDNCPSNSNPAQENFDGDTQGDVCDTDDDNDTLPDNADNCPLNSNFNQMDSDNDGIGDVCEDGLLDASFNRFGSGGSDTVTTTLVRADGKIFIGGSFTAFNGTARNRIARLNSDGSLDTSFNPGTGANSWIYTTALQADGKLIIGGNFSSFNGTARRSIARLNGDGSLDTSFNPGSGPNGTVYTTTVQADGKVIIGGYFTTFNGIARNYIARLNSNGSLDTTFNPGSGVDSYVWSIAMQADGKVMIGGDFTTFNGAARRSIARLNSDGSLDTSFNPGTGANSHVRSTALQVDGKLIIGGDFNSFDGTARNRIARLNSDGSLDTGFNPGTGANSHVWTTALQVDGRVIIGGYFTTFNGTARNYIARLDSDGSLDTTFNPGSGADSYVRTIAWQPDGNVVIGGYFTSYNGTFINRIARVSARLDIDFDDDNDGVLDVNDAFPLDPTESVDSDNDTIGNNADWDDDNDGVPDNIDTAPLNASDVSEITLPLDANYKGLQLKGAQDAIR